MEESAGNLDVTLKDIWACPDPPSVTRAQIAEHFLRNRDGEPWTLRGYQVDSLASEDARKVHCDGRDVGKTTEIEITAMWASMFRPRESMLIATQFEHHLFPLMSRVARRFESIPKFKEGLVESRRTPSWYMRFKNGFELWGRIAGPRGVNFQGMHVDWQIVDEAQELTEVSWGELFQALNGGGWRWVYGVPNGRRDTYYRLTQDGTVENVHWPSNFNPEFTAEKDEELARLYGGRKSAGYIHRVLGEHGTPAYGAFDMEDYLACVDETFDAVEVTICGDEEFLGPVDVSEGRYYLGCDLGYSRDPSEFVVYEARSAALVNVLRVRLEGVNYVRQEEVIRELDRAYAFTGIGIDAGNSGRAVAHQLQRPEMGFGERVKEFEFGSSINTGELSDGSMGRRPIKEFMTELIQRRMAERTIVFPKSADRESQYAGHEYREAAFGRIKYEKGDDHIIDADRCAVLRHFVDREDEDGVFLRPDVAVWE